VGATAAGIFVTVWISVLILLIGYLHPVHLLDLVRGLVIAATGQFRARASRALESGPRSG